MLFFVSVLLSSCFWEVDENEDSHPYIYITNNSKKSVHIVDKGDDTIPPIPRVYDSSSGCVALPRKMERMKCITSGASAPWEILFTQNIIDTLSIFIFDEELVSAGRAEEAFLQRYDMSLQDFRKVNWRLTYPPSEKMKSIKMWPSYEETTYKFGKED